MNKGLLREQQQQQYCRLLDRRLRRGRLGVPRGAGRETSICSNNFALNRLSFEVHDPADKSVETTLHDFHAFFFKRLPPLLTV